MSHVVSIAAEVRDPAAIRAACCRLKLPTPCHGETKLFSQTKTGWIVQLRDWRYPVVCDTGSGKVDYDNYEGRWGLQEELDAFLQGYAVEKTKIEARKQGHSVSEQFLDCGSVKLTVQVGDAT